MPVRLLKRHPLVGTVMIGLGLAAAAVGHPARPRAAEPPAVAATAAPLEPVTSLTVMSYNVEGLPAPVRIGRAESLERIAQRLAALRRAGRAPGVVMLQEAFTDPAEPIETIAGYRYVARGPDAEAVNLSPPENPAERQYSEQASRLKGEAMGKWESSGLRILSDYPIERVERLAFPEWACAGYDCLANKGVLVAWIAVPGSRQPVAFVDTHLNSQRAAKVSLARADEGYAFQTAAMRAFVARAIPPGTPAFFGGDFNTDTPLRWKELGGTPLAGGQNALLTALANDEVAPGAAADTRAILKRGKDWLYYRGGHQWRVRLQRYSVPFGTEPDGSTLSDHMGYAASFLVGNQRAS